MIFKVKMNAVITRLVKDGAADVWKFALWANRVHGRVHIGIQGGRYSSKSSCERGIRRIAKRMRLKVKIRRIEQKAVKVKG